jgi:DNA polymerase III alpha subunit
VDVFAAKNYRAIASLDELEDRALCPIAGAITQMEKRFRKSDGKPFAIVTLEDLTDSIEVFVWDDTYSKVADLLALGRVIAIQATIDRRDDRLRAVAQRVKLLSAERQNDNANGSQESANEIDEESAVLLRFTPETTREELSQVRDILVASPGPRSVQFLFERAAGDPVRLDAGAQFRVDLTHELEEKLSRWLVAPKLQ